MKICFFNLNGYSAFNPKSEAIIGGTERQLYYLSQYLCQDNKFDISYITADWGQKSIETYKNLNIYKSVKLKNTVINKIKSIYIIWKKLKLVNADIYIASSAGPEIGLIGLFCKINHKKFIYRTAHDMDCSGEYSQNGLFGKIYEIGIRSSTKIITQTENNQKMLRDNYSLKSIVLKNVYEIPSKQNIIKDKYVLWVGKSQKWKNPMIFLEIAKKHPQQKFVMICQKQKYQEQLFSEIKSKTLELKNVTLIENVDFDKIQEYFNKAYLFVSTSEYEGFPNTFIESAIGKTPIISYKVDPNNFINKTNSGVVCNGNINKISENILKLQNDKKLYKTMSANIFKYVKKNHDIEIIGKQWVKLLNNLMDK